MFDARKRPAPDLTTVQPEIVATLNGGNVVVGWSWNGHDALLDLCEIQVDRGDGSGFKLLTYDTTQNYTDTQPLPATPTKWTYKAIDRVNDAQVGVWSNPVAPACRRNEGQHTPSTIYFSIAPNGRTSATPS